MNKLAKDFISFVIENNGIGNKSSLIKKAIARFQFTKDRSVYYTKSFAVRFSFSSSGGFSNTVLSLSNLQKYDDMPFFVCLVKKDSNVLYLANSTFLHKISHSSQLLRVGDYAKEFDNYYTETDIKTKIMVLNSNPKAYNIDKMLEFLSRDKTVFMFYFIGIDPGKITNKILVSMFQKDILNSTILLKHWSGRNSRGVTQFEGNVIHNLILTPNRDIDKNSSMEFVKKLINL